MLLSVFYEKVEIHREEKIIWAKFLAPHRVLSTCRYKGGLRDDVDLIYNHQSCEPIKHDLHAVHQKWPDPDGYHRMICARQNLDPDRAASLGTAANMNNAALVEEHFRDLTVAAVVTGGVETNAGRVGDPASVYEMDGHYEHLDSPGAPEHGTINIMVFFNRELTEGALTRSIVTATEAKTSVLQELAVNSRYSDGLATGTGTDQIAVACLQNTGIPLSGAGKHVKLGELIGRAVYQGVKQTLVWQNQFTPDRQGSARKHLERFGLPIGVEGKARMLAQMSPWLSPTKAELLKNNLDVIDRDPATVGAVMALVHLRDKMVWGLLPETCLPELFASQGALVSASVSGKFDRLAGYRSTLATALPRTLTGDFLEFALKAMTMGFSEKWDHLED